MRFYMLNAERLRRRYIEEKVDEIKQEAIEIYNYLNSVSPKLSSCIISNDTDEVAQIINIFTKIELFFSALQNKIGIVLSEIKLLADQKINDDNFIYTPPTKVFGF